MKQSLSFYFFFLAFSFPSLGLAKDLSFQRRIHSALVTIQVEWNLKEEGNWLKKGRLYQGVGTGIIIHQDGYIITDRSLIPDRHHRVKAIFVNGTVHYAKIIAMDSLNPIVLLKIPVKTSHFSLQSSPKISTGQFVIAVGNTYGIVKRNSQFAISSGWLNDQYVLFGKNYRGTVLEITASVNPGSFGGALINKQGKLVGMLCSLYSKKKWLGLAIPIHQIKKAFPYLKKGLSTPSGELGLAIIQKKNTKKIIIDDLLPSGSAFQMGIQKGDILERIESHKIFSLKDVDHFLHNLPLGTLIEITFRRGKTRKNIILELKKSNKIPFFHVPKPAFLK